MPNTFGYTMTNLVIGASTNAPHIGGLRVLLKNLAIFFVFAHIEILNDLLSQRIERVDYKSPVYHLD